MKLRPAHIDDAAAINELILQFLSEFMISPDDSGAERFLDSVSVSAKAAYMSDSRYRYIVATEDTVLAGFIALRDDSHIFHLFVAREFQRQGLARQLWNAATAAAESTKSRTEFTVNSSPSASPIYERFGFKKNGPPVEKHGIRFVPMHRPCTSSGSVDSDAQTPLA
ncbi:acetyltransferase family protein [Collimonas arenae]|uniref:Acetyltransferase family protein n=1 Tax=Collimonas arenae TaxID=279058 RepID=A0A127QKT0_9BURK|nr:GNAT family N-acetyltransferase [Collimonas arenae]AMP00769.1 acetyltransferase family protein [Collimonas arenae]AMP10661.1 acetyltransferase family protein [Collimonas arenae]